MNDVILIRPYALEDSDATIDVFLRAIREVSSKDYSSAKIKAWAEVGDREGWADRGTSRPTWVAEIDGKVIGFSDLTAEGCLDMMFVHPEFQGMDIASCLLKQVEDEARKQGFCRIYTEASSTSRRFFEHKGFRVVTKQTVEKRGQALVNFLMEKHYVSTV